MRRAISENMLRRFADRPLSVLLQCDFWLQSIDPNFAITTPLHPLESAAWPRCPNDTRPCNVYPSEEPTKSLINNHFPRQHSTDHIPSSCHERIVPAHPVVLGSIPQFAIAVFRRTTKQNLSFFPEVVDTPFQLQAPPRVVEDH